MEYISSVGRKYVPLQCFNTFIPKKNYARENIADIEHFGLRIADIDEERNNVKKGGDISRLLHLNLVTLL